MAKSTKASAFLSDEVHLPRLSIVLVVMLALVASIHAFVSLE